jgi:hypothetical protein
MECQRCKITLKEGESYTLNERDLCEECYMYETNPPRGCDPTAVSSALFIRKQLGQSGNSGLTEQQDIIYKTIVQSGKITKEELIETLNINPMVLEHEFAFFRHCELVRAFRENGKVYFTKWEK